MLIALVTETYPPEVNGVARTLQSLVNGMSARGHRLVVVRPRQGKADRPATGPDVAEWLVTGFPLNRDYDLASLSGFVSAVRAFKKVRLLGTAALAVAYVACGRVDAYHEEDIMLWDIAAGVALVAAAGGFVRVVPSAKSTWARHVHCASDGRLFAHTTE